MVNGENLSILAQPFDYSKNSGKVIGKHSGAHFYTIGQRKGLNIGAALPVADVPARPEALTFAGAPAAPAPAATDAYSLRLVLGRKLYDEGTLVAHSPSLANLAPPAAVHLAPKDHDRLGVGVAGVTEVRIRSARGDVVVPAVADKGLAAGTAALAFRQPGVDAAALLDVTEPVTVVRIESVTEGGAS